MRNEVLPSAQNISWAIKEGKERVGYGSKFYENYRYNIRTRQTDDRSDKALNCTLEIASVILKMFKNITFNPEKPFKT